jgi:hypothetical protein
MAIETGEMTGEPGFVPEMWRNWANYMPSAGRGFGHDIIEHGLMTQTGAFDEEVAAHGAILFTTNFLNTEPRRFFTPAESLASGMSSQFKESTVDYIREAPKHRGVSWDERRQIKEFALEYVAKIAKEWYDEAYTDYCTKDEVCDNYPCGETLFCVGACQDPCDCEECNNPFEGRESFRKIFGWMLYGYGRAKRGYKGEQWTAYQMKKEIETVSERAMKNFREYADTGATFIMRLDFNETEVTIKPTRDPYGEW